MAYDAGAAFARIEREMIESMMRNLRRYHLDWEAAEGFDWSQWQVEQLKYLEEYRKANVKRFGPQFQSINAAIREAIEHGYQNGQNAEELRILEALAKDKRIRRQLRETPLGAAGDAFFRINDRKLEALLQATERDMQKAEYAVLRRTNDQYRQIIFNAQMYANTGAGTVEKAVDMATHDFLAAGINCIEYKNGARHTIADYADMAVRTAERRAYLTGEGQKRQEWGVSLVIVNKRSGHACPQCAKWLGKILIDDVYSGGKPDGKHTLLSEAMRQGFLHPRCKDGFTTYFPGVSSVPDPVSREDLQEAAQAEAEENREANARRQAEKYERLAKYSLDPENKRMYAARAEEWQQMSRRGSGYKGTERAPAPGELISAGELQTFAEEVEKRGYRFMADVRDMPKTKFGGFDLYRGKPEKLYEILDELDKSREFWPERLKRKGVLIGYGDFGNIDDFAQTVGRNIVFNKRLYDDTDYLEWAYSECVKEGLFVKGTSEKSIPWHEIGHVIAKLDPRLPIRLLKAISNKGPLREKALQLTSIYGINEAGGEYPELLSELFSAAVSTDRQKRIQARAILKEVLI